MAEAQDETTQKRRREVLSAILADMRKLSEDLDKMEQAKKLDQPLKRGRTRDG